MDYKHVFDMIEQREIEPQYKVNIREYIEARMAAGLSLYSLKGRAIIMFQVIKWLDNNSKNLESFREETTFNSYIAHTKLLGHKDSTINTNKVLIKGFLLWYFKENPPLYLDKIEYNRSDRELIENNLIKPSEIKLMVEKAIFSRDKALIITLYESGARISELLNVHIKDVEFREQQTVIKIRTSKTKKREVPLFDSTQYLLKWINEHPYRNDPEAFVFISLASNYKGHMLYAATVGRMLKIFAKEAGINKYIHCHLLRHSRISWWAKAEKLNERDLRILCGWSERSDMPNTYIHYNIDGVLEKMKRYRGLSNTNELEQEKERQMLKSKMCPRCGKENTPDGMFCFTCGMALTRKSIIQLEEIRKQEAELQQQILSKNIEKIKLDSNIDLKEAMYQILKSDPRLIEKLQNIVTLTKEVPQ
jgi:integrase